MRLKNLFFFILIAVLSVSLWAGGGRDSNDARIADDPSGFTDEIDISEKKPGKWNFYLEATDKAGNITIAGPENIWNDPESDLPKVTIINPMPNMHVQGNLNIVGIAFDDDGVQQVEFTVNRGVDGRGEELARIKANGTDYWSYFLDTTDAEIWTDGNYTITAWATDITDLSGIADEYPNGMRVPVKAHKTHTVMWRLDRKKPETSVMSHDVGALVSGAIRLRGVVTDGNGIGRFSYSIDGGEKYINTNAALDKRTGEYAFDIQINTKLLEDGAQVVWFRAVDGCGTEGSEAHLLFVNNNGPNVKIVYPGPNETVNGLFSIAGFAQHPVGLRSLSWKAGTQSGEIELFPGNHWWTANIDLRGQRNTSVDVEVRGTDVSGNVTIARQRYKVDPNADLPVVTLTEPATGVVENELGLVVKGTAKDDDGVAAILYSVNAGSPVEIISNGSFQFLIRDLPEGTHNLEVWARDVNGVVGNRAVVRGIVIPGALPQPGIASFTYEQSKRVVPFYTGMTLSASPVVNRVGEIIGAERVTMQIAYRGTTAPAAATITIGDGSPTPLRLSGSRDLFTASIPWPDNLSDGLNQIRLTATDRFGRETTFDEYVYVNNQIAQYEGDNIALRFAFSWARPNMLSDGRIVLKQDEELIGISTMRVNSASITGGSGLTADVDEYGRVILRAIQEGDLGQFTMRLVTEDGAAQNTAPFRVLSSFSEPSIILQGVVDNTWVRTGIPVRANVTSRTRLRAVEFSTDMGYTWGSMGPVSAEFNRNIDVSGSEDGSVNILIKATNEAGQYSVANFTVLKDTLSPQAQLVAPVGTEEEEARVNGTIRMAFAIEEFGKLQTVTYRRNINAQPIEVFNANDWDKDYAPDFLEVLMDSLRMPLDNNMRFTFTDISGNTSEVSTWNFVIDQEMDIPIVHIIMPLDNEVITTDFIVSGVMFDDDGIKQIQWRVDVGAWQTIETENAFSIPIELRALTDNEHTVTIIAEDIYGVRSAPEIREFRVSLSEPAAAMTFPLHDTVNRETIEMRGTAFDRNGIQRVAVSLDNGNTFNTTRGTFGTASENIQWNFSFQTKILKDGPHVVFIRVWDRYDIPATYANMINIDNTEPEVILDSPGDGLITTARVSLMGRVLDPNLSEVSIQLRSLEGNQLPAALRSRRVDATEVIRETFDLTGQADGHYNMVVVATDKAGNVSRTSRNVELARLTLRNYVEVLYPLDNEDVSGEFIVYGYAGGSDAADAATIRINGRDSESVEVDDTGFFKFILNSEHLQEGPNAIVVHSNFGGSGNVLSRSYNLNYKSFGPWVTIDNFNFGNFAYDRPYMHGRAGYVLSEEDQELLADRATDRDTRAAILAKTLSHTEISYDNGRTFEMANKPREKGTDYRYRIETYDMPEGLHYIVLKSTMKNGEYAVTRMMVQVDKTFPVIRLISPEAGGRYNMDIAYSASATDDVELVSLTYHLRIGDKAMYAVPGFLQGLYLEGTIPPFLKQAFNDLPVMPFGGGATFFDVGLGLSFFDDNVKIQGNYGYINQDIFEKLGGEGPLRYGGHVIGFKIIANVYTLPFITVWGPDFEWLYGSIGIGANFSYFDAFNPETDKEKRYTQSGKATWMSALLLQLEFPKVSIPKRKNFRTFSMFTEGQLWFIPTDVDADQLGIAVMLPKVVIGLRMYIF